MSAPLLTILYAPLGKRWDDQLVLRYFQSLPKKLVGEIVSYLQWEDRQRAAIGKLLLQHALVGYGYQENILEQLRVTSHGKPFLDEPVHFSITHSSDWVAVAVSPILHVGIDLEKIDEYEPADFRDTMSYAQWQHIRQSDYSQKTFYRYWTAKEAAIKADGRGLSIPLQQVATDFTSARIETESIWHLYELSFIPGYSGFVATDHPLLQDPRMIRMDF